MSVVGGDVRFAVRNLILHPGFSWAVAGILAIGMANPERCVVLPAGQSEDALEQENWDTLLRRIPELEVKDD